MDLDSKVSESMMKDYPKEPVADLVHIVRQRRVMAAKQAALKDEEERKDKERYNKHLSSQFGNMLSVRCIFYVIVVKRVGNAVYQSCSKNLCRTFRSVVLA